MSVAPAKAVSGRLHALDGMRGWAAVIVFAHHALVLLYGPLAGVNQHHWAARPAWAVQALHRLPVAWVFNGAFAVSFFFVLSGFVLTRAMGSAPAPARIATLVAARFLRLLPLVLIGTTIGYLTFPLCITQLDRLLPLTGNDSTAYIHKDLLADHSLLVACKQAAASIWRGAHAEELLDPPLWSIGLELQGSLLVYLLAGAFATTRNRLAALVVALATATTLMGPDAISFLTGMALAEHSRPRGAALLPWPRWLIGLLAALSLAWASVHPWDPQLWLPLPRAVPLLIATLLNTAGSVVLMAAGLQLAWLHALLTSRLSQWLGQASYGLYVIHVPILYLATAPVLQAVQAYCRPPLVSLITCCALLLACCAAGDGLIRLVDTPLAKRSKNLVARHLLS